MLCCGTIFRVHLAWLGWIVYALIIGAPCEQFLTNVWLIPSHPNYAGMLPARWCFRATGED